MSVQDHRTPFASRTVGEIAATLPGATAIFRKFRLDFCCGGDVALSEAADLRGVALSEIERDLAALEPQEGGAAAGDHDTLTLVEHIVSRYHDTHRRELPELIRLARKVEAVHATHPRAPRGLADVLHHLAGELEVHMKKEELILFPAMQSASGVGTGPMLGAPIAQMRHDHDDHGDQLRRIEEITDSFRLPAEACRSWQALYGGVAKLASDLMEHIHLENNVLFPRFEERRGA